MHSRDWLLVFIGFFIPPIPVYIKRGLFSADFLINILLCILGIFPGIVHCYYIILSYPYEEGYSAINGNEERAGYGSTN